MESSNESDCAKRHPPGFDLAADRRRASSSLFWISSGLSFWVRSTAVRASTNAVTVLLASQTVMSTTHSTMMTMPSPRL